MFNNRVPQHAYPLTNVTLLSSNIRVSKATLNTLQNTLICKNSATEEALQRFILKKNINFFFGWLMVFRLLYSKAALSHT